MTHSSLSSTLVKNLYTRMLLTRTVAEYVYQLDEQGYAIASCRGHEAAQVGSAICIEVGQDFTLPYYRDLGVVLTIGMTPYEVFHTHLQIHTSTMHDNDKHHLQWGYHKHNMVSGAAPVATQILHAAGIAFASKLRKAPVVTVAYCDDAVVSEPDFLEGIRFAALHHLPVIFVCEHICKHSDRNTPSCMQGTTLPDGLTHQCIDGTDVVQVYTTMQNAMQHAREGQGPILLEMTISHFASAQQSEMMEAHDPLLRCQQFLQEHEMWDEAWAAQLHARINTEVEHAMHDALRDTQHSTNTKEN